MQAKWGNTPMPVNGAEVTSQMTVAEATDDGRPLRYLAAYNVLVYLDGDGQNDLSAKEDAFRTALMKPDQDFVLYTDDGKKSSAKILFKDTAGGTRVVNISTPEAKGGEFVTRRTIGFTITAEYHVKNSERALVYWRESLTIVGNGGPRRVWRFPINARAIRQTIAPYSLVRAVQQGTAVGYLARPKRPRPIFPDYLVNESPVATIDSPKLLNLNFDMIDWPVSWSYTFERGDGPLVGVPGLPPGVI